MTGGGGDQGIWEDLGGCGLRELDPGMLGHEDRVDTGPASDPGGSQMQLLRDESSRKPSGQTQVYPPCVFAHCPCWQRPPVAHSSTSMRNGVIPKASGPAPRQPLP